MQKTITIAAVGLLVGAYMSLATPALQWQITSTTSPSSSLTDGNNVALTGSKTSAIIGCFVQLLWAGGNGVADAINFGNLDGHGGDDQVLAWGFVGYGTGLGTTAGYFNSGSSTVTGRAAPVSIFTVGVDNFYIRTWNAPASSSNNYNLGYAPIGANGSATAYGNSQTHTLADNPTYDNWALTSGFKTDQPLVVPEPATLALMGLGLALMAIRRRR